jgi:2-octaprenyl-6-methoxyphenol hydroxylase
MTADIVVRGAGPVGCALALLLQRAGRTVTLVSAQRPSPAPGRGAAFRPIALSHASRLILDQAGAWPGFAASAIDNVHVSQQGAFGRVRLTAADAGVPALGYVTDYGALVESLLGRVRDAGIRVRTDVAGDSDTPEPADAALVVHAEGSSPQAREKPYAQDAVLALVTPDPPASGTAWERFTPEGPLALLPLEGRYGMVWGMRPERARALCDAPEATFLAALAAAFGRRAGAFLAATGRHRAPLALRVRPSRTGARSAYIGNAAQTLHPVAGQGLNLGLRDAWDLAQVLRDAEDPGAPAVLQRFSSLRRLDAAATVRATDFLAGVFLGDDRLSGLLRGLGLTALDICLPARRFLARRMIYGASALP